MVKIQLLAFVHKVHMCFKLLLVNLIPFILVCIWVGLHVRVNVLYTYVHVGSLTLIKNSREVWLEVTK